MFTMIEEAIQSQAEVTFQLSQLLRELDAISRQVMEDLFLEWEKVHMQELAELVEISDKAMQKLKEIAAADFDSAKLLRDLEQLVQEILGWTDSLNYVDEAYSPDTFSEGFQARFSVALHEVPQFMNVAVRPEDWLPKRGDPKEVRIWKLFKRLQARAAKQKMHISNAIRKGLRQPPQGLGPTKRNIAVHAFLKFAYEFPVTNFLFTEWQRSLREIALQLQKIHHMTEAALDDLLSVKEGAQMFRERDQSKVRDKLDAANGHFAQVATHVEEFRRFCEARKDSFNEYLSEIGHRLQDRWELAGTAVLPNSKFSEKQHATRVSEFAADFERVKQQWIEQFTGERDDWRKDLELLLLEMQLMQVCVQTLASLDQKVHKQILPTLEEPSEMVTESLEKFKELQAKEEAELKKAILAEGRSMLRDLRREKLPRAMDAVSVAQITKTMENYASRNKFAVEKLQDRHHILLKQDLEELRPDCKIVEVSMKDLILDEVYPHFVEKYGSFKDEIQEKLDKVVRDISEVDQIVEFNLEAALELLQNGDESEVLGEAHEVVIEGLDHARDQLEALIEQCKAINVGCKDSIWEATLPFVDEINQLGDNEKIVELKYRVAKAKTQQEVRSYYRKGLEGVKTSLPTVLNFLTTSVGKIQTNYLRIRRFTGLMPVMTDVEERLTQFVTQTQKRIDDLPYVYKRLFRIEPLSDERFFSGRTDDLVTIKTEFDSWQKGQYGVTAIVGEKGSGRTTLINFARQQIFDKLQVVSIPLSGLTLSTEEVLLEHFVKALNEEPVETFDDLESGILDREDVRVVIVEDIQNLFVRTIDGFDAIERFFLLVTRTHTKIYWLLSCTLYSWGYLDKVLNISKFFQRVIMIGGLTEEEIEGVILKRHRVSGYRLVFETPDDIAGSKKFKKLATDEARQDYLKDLFFKRLNQLASSNITVTMMFWQSAIRGIQDDQLVINPELTLDYSFLHQLPMEELFALAALLQHEMLSVNEYSKIFQQDVRQSALLLKRMAQRGMLHEKSDGQFQINFLLYRAAIQVLKVKNILH